MRTILLTAAVLALAVPSTSRSEDPAADEVDDRYLRLEDVFELEYASDPQVSPDGRQVVYVRNFMDIMKDRRRSNLWIMNSDGSAHRPLTSGESNDVLPRWSPDGKRLSYVSQRDGSAQIYCRWMPSGETGKISRLRESPRDIRWSPDGKRLALVLRVPAESEPLVKLPAKPEGAEWAEPPKVIRDLRYRYDGQGYLKKGYDQLFVLDSEGGTPRQLTAGPYDQFSPPSWTADSRALIFSSHRQADWQHAPRESNLFRVDLETRKVHPLTTREGPDSNPVVSPDGRQIAYLGFDDRKQGYQVTRLHLMSIDGGSPRVLTDKLDRSVREPAWNREGTGVYYLYDDQGITRIGFVKLNGAHSRVAENIGGTTIGRPYSSGQFSVGGQGVLAFTQTSLQRPADIAVQRRRADTVTRLNEDLLGHKQLADVESFWIKSKHDQRPIQCWLAMPPNQEGKKKVPLILEIHGGPFANYGSRFSVEVQLYAAAGYAVLYVNPRGSTSYGEAFGNLIHHAYPGHDYDDLMSAVDEVIKRPAIDADQLYVTGGSGGGVLTSWIVGKTDRFRAAVAAKPVINWTSFALTADAYPYFTQYWFPGMPWEAPEAYRERSPLSLVGNVRTPTMLLTGEVDFRTPISESEQFYQALKLRKIDAALVRIPGASHGIANRPSHLIAKVAHVLKWFEMHNGE